MPKKTSDTIGKRQDKKTRAKDKSGKRIYSTKSIRIKQAVRAVKN
jgi:hypothetical protein